MNEKFEPRQCANCGDLFTCRGDMHCWCVRIEVPEKVQDYIAACFDGCLCEKCIKKLITDFEMKTMKQSNK